VSVSTEHDDFLLIESLGLERQVIRSG